MARAPRVHFKNAIYHVMLRGNGGQDIFFTDKDRFKFYDLIEECVDRFNFYVHGFCLMSNHVHLIIQIESVSISKIMQNISFRYAKWVNARLKRVGHLFQGRFKAKVIDSDSYLLQVIRYIHFNPVDAQIVKHVDDYLWSSHSAYMHRIRLPWLTINFVLNYFSNDNSLAVDRYHKFMFDFNRLESDINADCFDKYLQKPTNFFEIQDSIKEKKSITFEIIVSFVCDYYQVDRVELKSLTRTHSYAKIRAIVAWLTSDLKVGTLTMVAKYFNRNVTGIIRSIRKLERLEEERNKFLVVRNLLIKSTSQA